ncbi:transmembrane protein 87A [Toxorhynchites rutilus septentrionalis]|uniref:transmembrane protein 87A n=1 Tax=Toxorhynchites rutilus septentrionalis TaxID=329112 RepID=UPI0024790541|nr:transmembrane protein 87A [Toxorhynchites rutilus septentrionalis]XP_055641215.1 transmembrane protein 87A [Toxorhynchites rutilus septentrionalis]
MKESKVVFICCFCSFFGLLVAFPEQGKWDFTLTADGRFMPISKSVFAGFKIYTQINCEPVDPTKPSVPLKITWTLLELKCWEEYIRSSYNLPYEEWFLTPNQSKISSDPIHETCSRGGHISLPELKLKEPESKIVKSRREAGQSEPQSILTITKDGLYIFILRIEGDEGYIANVHVEMKGPHGYLSAVDWPLLPFYGAMCLVYVLLGVIWLAVSFLQWRDLLRIQFWIGGVILLGMLEKAMFYGEYQSINSTGVSVRGMVLLAEWVSCGKRTLARMLVIIVSLGFGIVKPRLGPMLHRVVGTGFLYLVLACVESFLRIMHTKNDQLLVASIPLAVLDSAICWWIFTSLVQTTRTLRLRRNMVKLTLYRHFTNTLIFAVLASVVFMLYSIKVHRFAECLTDWKDLWVDDAFWHVLFSTLLLVIMILWRPTNNNQRYAFTPLLDNPEDEDDDEEEQFVSDAYGVKMRGARSASPKPNAKSPTNEEDDLKWVEDNIPAAIADAALPVLDSDEEIVNTKFEVSKMQ